MAENEGSKFWVVAAALAMLLALLQMTPFALLAPRLGGFVRGLAVGLCIVLLVIWLGRRAGRV